MTLKSSIYRISCGFINYSRGLARALGLFSERLAHALGLFSDVLGACFGTIEWSAWRMLWDYLVLCLAHALGLFSDVHP